MKIIEAINRIDSLKANGYTQSEKVEWLSTIDGMIYDTIIKTHEGDEDITFDGYKENTPIDTELLAYAPYDELYIYYLASKIDYYNGEYNKYNNSITAFNDIYREYTNDYNRKHMPKGKSVKFF